MEVIENILRYRYVKRQKSQNRQMSYFSFLCQIQFSLSQNRPVQLVSCFIGVHHIFKCCNRRKLIEFTVVNYFFDWIGLNCIAMGNFFWKKRWSLHGYYFEQFEETLIPKPTMSDPLSMWVTKECSARLSVKFWTSTFLSIWTWITRHKSFVNNIWCNDEST